MSKNYVANNYWEGRSMGDICDQLRDAWSFKGDKIAASEYCSRIFRHAEKIMSKYIVDNPELGLSGTIPDLNSLPDPDDKATMDLLMLAAGMPIERNDDNIEDEEEMVDIVNDDNIAELIL